MYYCVVIPVANMKFCWFVLIILNCLNYLVLIEMIGLPKYDIIIDHLELPESRVDKLFNFGTLRVKKFNRTTYCVDGYFETLRKITENILITYEIYAWQGNEYRGLTDRKYLKDICAESKKYKPIVLEYLKSKTDVPPDYECPFPISRYNFYNAEFSNQIMPFEPPRGEKFRINITCSLEDEILSTLSIYYTLKKLPPTMPGI